MSHVDKTETSVEIHLDSDEDVWFWQRRFNVFDFMEIFPATAIAPAVAEGQTPPVASTPLTFDTDADFQFESDIVRGGFYLRNQSHGTRKWMTARKVSAGDTIVIERTGETTYRLSKQQTEGES